MPKYYYLHIGRVWFEVLELIFDLVKETKSTSPCLDQGILLS
jgi:hypothetical protein